MAKTFQFQDIQVNSPGFGAMGLSFGLGSNLSLEEAEPVLLKAIELGCTFWDTAVSQWLSNSPLNTVAHDPYLRICFPRGTNLFVTRLFTRLVSTRSFSATSLESTTFATRCSVSGPQVFSLDWL